MYININYWIPLLSNLIFTKRQTKKKKNERCRWYESNSSIDVDLSITIFIALFLRSFPSLIPLLLFCFSLLFFCLCGGPWWFFNVIFNMSFKHGLGFETKLPLVVGLLVGPQELVCNFLNKSKSQFTSWNQSTTIFAYNIASMCFISFLLNTILYYI